MEQRVSKRLWPYLILLGLAACLCLAQGHAAAGEVTSKDKTSSPYFFVKGDQQGIDQLPLKSTRAEVNISGVVAEVTIFQRYANNGKNTLEGIYIFPASTRAAVHRLKIRIGEREIMAKIEKRAKARKDYEEARSQGRTAALLEQQRPNVFQMNVANILPGDEIKVELAYTELLSPIDGIYEYVFPTVVGPRYVGRPEGGSSETWTNNPYLPGGEASPFKFKLDLTLSSPLAVQKIACPSHEANIKFLDPKRVRVSLPESDIIGNRDFVLHYALADKRPTSGLLLSKGEKDNYFLWLMEPPKSLTPQQVLPREYIFVLDVSGSMRGFPLDTAKDLMLGLLGKMQPRDSFNILFFAGDSLMLSPKSMPATKENIANAVRFVQQQRGGGGTELLPALTRAMAMPRSDENSRSVVLITDGYVHVEKRAFDLVQRNLGQANLFVFGVGSSVNRYLLEGLARAGQGEAQVVLNRGEGPDKVRAFSKSISYPTLRDIKVSAEGFAMESLEPAVVPDLFFGRSLMIVGKYRGKAHGRIIVQGRGPDGAFRQVMDVAQGEQVSDSALPRLWARKRIAALSDLNRLSPDDKRVAEVVALGLEYNLLTDYTSFVAIDTQVRAKGGESITVKQPLPLPAGVPNSAIGGVYTSAPTLAYNTPPQSPGRGVSECVDVGPDGGSYSFDGTKKKEEKPWTPWLNKRDNFAELAEMHLAGHKTGCAKDKFPLALERLRFRLNACIRQVASKPGKLSGELTLKICMGPDGRLTAVAVSDFKVTGPHGDVQRLRNCLATLGEPGNQPTAAVCCAQATVKVVLK